MLKILTLFLIKLTFDNKKNETANHNLVLFKSRRVTESQ